MESAAVLEELLTVVPGEDEEGLLREAQGLQALAETTDLLVLRSTIG